jgi:hypothetical protein
MKRFFIIFIILYSASIFSGDKKSFRQYSDSNYGFTIKLPNDWRSDESDIGYKHIISLKKGRSAEIRISSSKIEPDEVHKWDTWGDWYISGLGFHLLKILETKSIVIEHDIVGKVLLFEYTAKPVRMLQRVLVAKLGDTIVVIECFAAVNEFRKHTESFNAVMGSLRILDKKAVF